MIRLSRPLALSLVVLLLLCGGALFRRVIFPSEHDLGIVSTLRYGDMHAVALDPAGSQLAIAQGSGAVILLGVDNGQERLRLPGWGDTPTEASPPQAPWLPEHLAFSPDGRYLAQADQRRLRIWALDQRRVVALAGAPMGQIGALGFLPDGRLQARYVAGGIYRWRLPDGVPEVYPAAPLGQWDVWDFGGRGRLALACAQVAGGVIPDLVVSVSEVGGAEIGRVAIPAGGLCQELALSPDEGTLIVKSSGERYYLLDWRAGSVRATVRIDGANDGGGIGFSPDGALAYLGGNGVISVRRARDGREVGTVRALRWFDWVPPVRFAQIQVSADGRLLVANCGDLAVRVWRL